MGSLILQDEAGNEESQSIASQLGNVQNEYGEINTSMGLECEQVADPRLGRGVSKEDIREILADDDELSRPVTQPVLTSVNLKSDLPRSKTASILSRKKKQFRRQGSMPVKLRHVATIKEDVQQNFQEITREKTEAKKEEMVESKENIGRDTRIGDDIGQEETQPNEGISFVDLKIASSCIYCCLTIKLHNLLQFCLPILFFMFLPYLSSGLAPYFPQDFSHIAPSFTLYHFHIVY